MFRVVDNTDSVLSVDDRNAVIIGHFSTNLEVGSCYLFIMLFTFKNVTHQL
jgi:hypothetical protein